MQARRELNEFFVAVQARALRHAEIALRNRDAALDVLQDAMIKLAQNYADKPDEWPMLFQRILQNAIIDWYRRQKVRRIFTWFGGADEFEAAVTENQIDDGHELHRPADNPEQAHQRLQISRKVESALTQLPLRQQQAFLLRAWWGHDIDTTAAIMKCSSGSVKTHYSRAQLRMREILQSELLHGHIDN